MLVAACYRRTPAGRGGNPLPAEGNHRIAVGYLCCDDMDAEALDNIVCFCVLHDLPLYVHDDSDSGARNDINRAISELMSKYKKHVDIIRRASRQGGKPGAVNNLVTQLRTAADFLLLCDSDSFLLNAELLGDAVAAFDDFRVALVQFNNIGYVKTLDSSSYRILAKSIDFYDAFVSFSDRFGWSPFLGHNALIRLSAFREVGGFSPGEFADDIDFSVKLRLAGYKIRYARCVVGGERHPLTYTALRRRTAKWSYGCTQVLLKWAVPILFSGRLAMTEKASFFLTVAYYHFQVLLLIYLTIFYLVLPFETSRPIAMNSLVISGGLILALTFLPSMTYFARHRKLSQWPKIALVWGLTYGSQDFVILRAIVQCLRRTGLVWVPTNKESADLGISRFPFLWEVSFGFLILAIGAWKRPVLLLLPTTALFAGKFLVTPWLDAWMFARTQTRNGEGLRRAQCRSDVAY